MPREGYQTQLDELRADVVAMGELVLDRYDTALEALETGDPDLAEQVIEGDHDVNEIYLDLESECTELLALQQPVAGDLRLVAASFKIITDLERVGDLATNLASYGRPDEGGTGGPVDLQGPAGVAGMMVSDALDAYEAGDPVACRRIAARDDDLDRTCEHAADDVVRSLLDRHDGGTRWCDVDGRDDEPLGTALDDVSRALLTIRDVERVGDHAVNIAARTLYMLENDPELIY